VHPILSGDAFGAALVTRVAKDAGGDVAVVHVEGTLDLASAARFDSAVAAAFELADACDVEVSGLSFIDSTGLRCLLRARRVAGERGRRFRLVGELQPLPDRVVTLTGLRDHLFGG